MRWLSRSSLRRIIWSIGLCTIIPTLAGICATRACAQSTNGWFLEPSDFSTVPVDLSFLNVNDRPAGRRGFLRVDGEHLVFEDGTKARFWGTNLTGRALFLSSKMDVQRQAHRLARLGFNLVRIHHHDASWVDPNIFGHETSASAGQVDETAVAQLDWLIKCLEDEGIYIWLDLYDSRLLKNSENIEAFGEITKNGTSAQLKGYNFVNRSIERALQAFNEQFLNHVNIFTGVRYVDDPGIAAVLIINENDITNHFGNFLLPDKNVPYHTAQFMLAAKHFAATHSYRLEDVWRSWQVGIPKIFLNDLEHGFHARMVQHLRRLGLKIPIVPTSQWGGNSLSSLPALTTGDVIDVHGYGGPGEISKDPNQRPTLISEIAAGRVLGFPLTVTEWNVSPFPVRDRHTIPLYLASNASFQGWSALMQYAYTQRPLSGVNWADNWEGGRDPSLIATFPAAALLFRRGDVNPAKATYVFAPTRDQLFKGAITPAVSVAMRTAPERGKFAIQLPDTTELSWLTPKMPPVGAFVFSDPDISFVELHSSRVATGANELTRDWRRGVFTVDTDMTQVASGEIGGLKLKLRSVQIEMQTSSCTIAVQSLTSQPLEVSDRILLSLGGESTLSGSGRLPFASAPLVGNVAIRAKQGLSLFALVNDGPPRAISFNYQEGFYQVDLALALGSHWLLLQAVNPN